MSYISTSMQRVVPTTGQTITPTNAMGDIILVLEPAGTLATLTVNTPSTPVDGQRFSVMSTQIITALTLAVGTVIGGLASFAANGFMTLVYNASQTKWYRLS